MKNFRKLTVERRWRAGKWRTITPIAQILLKGKWLEQAGFAAGDQVNVEVVNGCLTIRSTGFPALAG
jgi:hypothetical protein